MNEGEKEIRKKSIEKRWERQTKAVCVANRRLWTAGGGGRDNHAKRTR